jgi:hypothetical protein
VNVSSRQLFRPELISEVRHLLSRAVIPKGSLRLEITESLAMENPEKAAAVLEQLAVAGAGLSLDDFGTGYSSLSYLTQFSFDTIKVDRAFVQARTQNGTGAVVLRSIIALAQELGKKVVAEGVEAEDDVAFLRSVGCEYAQGYYYGEPMAERDLLQLLKVVRRAERRLRRSTLFRQRAKPRTESAQPAAASPQPAARRAPAARRQPAPRPPQLAIPSGPAPAAGTAPGVRPAGPPPLPRNGPAAPAAVLSAPPSPLRPAATGDDRTHPRPPPLPGNGAAPVASAAAPTPGSGPRPGPPPLPRRTKGRPPPDFSRLPPAIRASLARLAGEIAAEEAARPPADPPTPDKPPGAG